MGSPVPMMFDPEVTPEVRALLRREAHKIIREVFEEQPIITNEEAAKVGVEKLTDRVLLYHQIEEATR